MNAWARQSPDARLGAPIRPASWMWLTLLLVAVPLVRAQNETATSSAQVDVRAAPTQATIGDPITLTVTVTCPPGVRALPPPPNAPLGPFEVRDHRVEQRERQDDSTETVALFEVAAYETGEVKIPSLRVDTIEADGTAAQLRTREIPVTIASVLPADDENLDIMPLRPPLDPPAGSVPLIAWLAGIGALLAAAGLFVWLRRRRKEAFEQPVEPVVLPEEQALAALAELENEGLLDELAPGADPDRETARERVKEYHVRLSHILRRYIERMFGLPALEETTFELVAETARVDLLREHTEGIRQALQQCDLAKFAKVTPPVDQSEAALKEVRWIVEQSATAYRRREAARQRAEVARAA